MSSFNHLTVSPLMYGHSLVNIFAAFTIKMLMITRVIFTNSLPHFLLSSSLDWLEGFKISEPPELD